MMVTSSKNHSPYGIACVCCDDRLIAPNWSEFVSEHQVRHSWSCEGCGHQFETSDHLRFNAMTKARREIRHHLPPLLVAGEVPHHLINRVQFEKHQR
jgi:hypothetical protein